MLNAEGCLVINLKLTLTKIVRIAIAEEFQQSCKDECSQNLSDLLDDTLSSDVKIATRDKTELRAHKVILRGIRCIIMLFHIFHNETSVN